MINPNSLFRWLSIRTKLIIAFVGLALLPLLIMGSYAVVMKVQMMEENALVNLSHDLRAIRGRSSAFLSSVESDVRILRNSPLTSAYLAGSSRHAPGLRSSPLEEQLLSFARERAVYDQIRIIAPDGTEMIRVEAEHPFDSLSTYRLVPEDELRAGRETSAFRLAEGAAHGQIVFEPAELSAPDGRPLPVFSFVAPVDEPSGRYLLIANVYARSFFDIVQENRHFADVGTIAIVNSDGQYLYHSKKKSDWNKLLASREEDVLQKDFPAPVAAAILSPTVGTITEGIDDIVAHELIFSEPSPFTNAFFVYESVPKSVLLGPVYTSAAILGGLLLLVLGVSAALAVVATRQFTRPVAEFQRSAEIIAAGGYNHRLEITTHDEIEILAGHFNRMAAALEEHERETRTRRATLEEMVAQRTQELSEEKSKLQGILDNVPSAIVLLDANYQILSASAAFTGVTELSFHNVHSVDCREAFRDRGQCANCVCRHVMESGEPATIVDHFVTASGAERYLEHTAIPMRENGVITRFLEIITDVTRRRQFEERAIRTERLLAVGEMAAFIAHQMRNGLTSVKMILQLQRESPSLPAMEKQSLEVALNSVGHLESVVMELLNFARPSPLVMKPASLNIVAAEAVSFVRPQLAASGVVVKEELDPTLPVFNFDATRVRESLANMLVNAVHATGPGGTITLRTARGTRRSLIAAQQADRGGDVFATMEGDLMQLDDDAAVLESSDSGPGIEQVNLPHIFEPFFSTKPGGSGLGLALVRRVVTDHGGIIAVRTGPRTGTTFSLVLPISTIHSSAETVA